MVKKMWEGRGGAEDWECFSVGEGGVWSRHEWGFILGLGNSLKMTVFSRGFTVGAIFIFIFIFSFF